LYFKPAPEPSNILWENQYWPKSVKMFRSIIAFLVVILIITLQIAFMFFINKQSVAMQSQYPIVDCKDVRSLYADTLQKFALVQWNDANLGKPIHSKAAYQCFCDGLRKNQGLYATLFTDFNTTTREGDFIHGRVCSYWLFGKVEVKIIKLFISVMIVAFNYILRFFIIKLVVWIGKKTISQQMNTIMIYIFFSQFINTALILLCVHSNFENTQVPILNEYANGQFPDFTMEWYFKVGAIFAQTLFIMSLSPFIDISIIVGQRYVN